MFFCALYSLFELYSQGSVVVGGCGLIKTHTRAGRASAKARRVCPQFGFSPTFQTPQTQQSIHLLNNNHQCHICNTNLIASATADYTRCFTSWRLPTFQPRPPCKVTLVHPVLLMSSRVDIQSGANNHNDMYNSGQVRSSLERTRR